MFQQDISVAHFILRSFVILNEISLGKQSYAVLGTDFGGGQRSNLIYRILRSIAEIDVLVITPNPPTHDVIKIAYGESDGLVRVVKPTPRGARFPWLALRFLAPKLLDRIAYNLGRRSVDYSVNPAVYSAIDALCRDRRYDLFIARHLKNAGQAGLFARNNVIVDVDDNDIELYRLLVEDPSTGVLRRLVLSRRIKTLEKLLAAIIKSRSAIIWVFQGDGSSHTRFYGAAKVLQKFTLCFVRTAFHSPTPLPS